MFCQQQAIQKNILSKAGNFSKCERTETLFRQSQARRKVFRHNRTQRKRYSVTIGHNVKGIPSKSDIMYRYSAECGHDIKPRGQSENRTSRGVMFLVFFSTRFVTFPCVSRLFLAFRYFSLCFITFPCVSRLFLARFSAFRCIAAVGIKAYKPFALIPQRTFFGQIAAFAGILRHLKCHYAVRRSEGYGIFVLRPRRCGFFHHLGYKGLFIRNGRGNTFRRRFTVFNKSDQKSHCDNRRQNRKHSVDRHAKGISHNSHSHSAQIGLYARPTSQNQKRIPIICPATPRNI